MKDHVRRTPWIPLAAIIFFPLFASADFVDSRGPVINTGMRVEVDREGVQAPGYIWQKPEPKTTWRAQWIASGAHAAPGVSSNCLRKEITLDQEPRKVTAWISSNNYLLYVNGKPAARGPADAGRDFTDTSSQRRFYDHRDLTVDFRRGKNALAVELLGCNNLLLELLVEYPDGKTVTIGTDNTWKGTSAAYLKSAPVPAEDEPRIGKSTKPLPLFDAQAEPVGWMLAGFDDSAWSACKIEDAPKETLVASELPPLMEARYPYFDISHVSGGVTVPDKPFQDGHPIIVKGDGEFSVHFDKIMAGRCGIKVKGTKGTRIYLSSNETDAWGGRIYQILLRDGAQSFESRDYYSLGTITVVVRNASAPVQIMDVSADFMSQPVEYKGSFACSDNSLNTLWKSGRWSTQICMITHHLDSPQHQEPISDYGDYLIADLVNYYSMGTNPWLARQDLRKWAWVMENARYKTFHTSYIFYWLQALINYYQFTGDRSMIDELASNVHSVIDQFSSYIGKNGIISEAPNYMFMDWVSVHDDKNRKIAFACHHPPAVIGQGYMTALFYNALADAIEVSKLTNDPVDVEKYGKLRQQIAAAYQRELWNPERGMYRDGKPFATSVPPGKWLPADVPMESFSVQNNALAVLYDLAPRERQASIVENMVANKNWDVTPYFMHFVFDSMAHAGLFGKYGVARMHEYKVIPATQTVREMGPDKGDYSHGWIASPTYQMSSKILGVSPATPGFDLILVRPEICGLQWAKGTVPTPHGAVDVAWQSAGDAFDLNVTVPHGTYSLVTVPASGAPASVRVTDANGKPAKAKFVRGEEGRAVYEVGAGSYRFLSTGLRSS